MVIFTSISITDNISDITITVIKQLGYW